MKKILTFIFVILLAATASGAELNTPTSQPAAPSGGGRGKPKKTRGCNLKKSIIISGSGNSYQLNAYTVTTIIGESIGGESSSSANFALSGGFLSNPQTIPGSDTTAPSTPVVIDDGSHTISDSILHATWSADDPESEIGEYLYSVPGVIDWTSVGPDTEVTLSGLQLQHGQTYYFEVVAKNNAGISSEIGSSDGITVNLSVPVISSLIPEDLTKIYAESKVDILATASDSDGDTLEYQIVIDGNIKQDWNQSNSFAWYFSSSDIGKTHLIQVNVADGNGAIVPKQSKIFILRAPITPPPYTNPTENAR